MAVTGEYFGKHVILGMLSRDKTTQVNSSSYCQLFNSSLLFSKLEFVNHNIRNTNIVILIVNVIFNSPILNLSKIHISLKVSLNPLTSRPGCMPGSRYTGVRVLFFVI